MAATRLQLRSPQPRTVDMEAYEAQHSVKNAYADVQ